MPGSITLIAPKTYPETAVARGVAGGVTGFILLLGLVVTISLVICRRSSLQKSRIISEQRAVCLEGENGGTVAVSSACLL